MQRQTQEVVWRRYRTGPPDGSFTEWTTPILPEQDGMMVLKRILNMPRVGKVPVDYDTAFQMFEQACVLNLTLPETTRESQREFRKSFIYWVSAQGFYIELKHDEYSSNHNPQ